MSLSPLALPHSALDLAFRIWNSRLAYVASLLLLLLQRTPLMRLLSEGRLTLAVPRFANILKFSTASSAVHFAGTHAVTGATSPAVSPVSPSTNPAEVTVGEPMVWVFSASIPGKKARSYRVEGLPPGIEYDGRVASNSLAALQGTPTAPGMFTVEITAFHFSNFQGEASPIYELALTVAGDAVSAPSVTKGLEEQLVSAGQTVRLTVEAEGSELRYVWEKDGTTLPDESAPTLVLENVTDADAGFYTVKISNAGGETASTAEVRLVAGEIPIPDGQTLYSLSARDSLLRTIQADGSTAHSIAITMEGHTVNGGAGLATDPTTGTLYALLKLKDPPDDGVGDRVVATLDPDTGEARLVGTPAAETLLKFAALAFDPQGQLYAVTGDDQGAVSPETLFTLDKTTGEAVELLALGNGDEGEAIAFDPESGQLLHASGGPAPQTQVLERIDTANQTISPIALQSGWKEGKALSALGPGEYLLADEEAFYLLTDAGAVRLVGKIDHLTKGLALAPNPADGSPFRITRIDHTAEGTVVLGFPALPGESYVIESTEDLVEWQVQANLTVSDGQTEAEFTDTEITPDLPARFYRATRN